MRTYSEIQTERIMKALQEPIETEVKIKLTMTSQELLQVIRFLHLEHAAQPSRAQIVRACVELIKECAVERIAEPTLEEAIVALYQAGFTDRLKFDLLQRMKEGRL